MTMAFKRSKKEQAQPKIEKPVVEAPVAPEVPKVPETPAAPAAAAAPAVALRIPKR